MVSATDCGYTSYKFVNFYDLTRAAVRDQGVKARCPAGLTYTCSVVLPRVCEN